MKHLNKEISIFLSVLLMGATLLSAAPVIQPFGSIEKTLKGGSDTWLSIPYRLPAIGHGKVGSVNGTTITAQEDTEWAVNQFTETVSQACYLLVKSGAALGLQLLIEANSENSVTLQNDLHGLLNELQAGDAFSIHPCWTLDILFPAGKSVHATQRLGDKQTVVLMPDDATKGTNLAASEAFYYYAGGAPFGVAGWRAVGQPFADAGSQVLDMETPLLVRHYAEASTEVSIMGEIPWVSTLKVVYAGYSEDSDTTISHALPFDMSLIESGLYQKGVFAGSSSPESITDRLLVFDPEQTGYNQQPTAVYYYLEGSSTAYGQAGWRRLGEPYNMVDDLTIFEPGQAYVIRKAPSSESIVWQGMSINP